MKDEKPEALFSRIQRMNTPEKMQLAAHGDKEARSILIREAAKQIQMAVVKNPRIQDSEIISICKSRHICEEVLRAVAMNRSWMKLYSVRLALVKNPKTPQAMAVKLVSTLQRQDLKLLSRSKDVPQTVANAARRRLLRGNV